MQLQGCQASTVSNCHLLTQAGNYRIPAWQGLAGPSVGHPPQPPAEAGSPTAGCTAPRPGGVGISPEKETPQPPWAAWARAPSPSEGRSSSSGSAGASLASVCARCPLSCHWAPLERVWPRPPDPHPADISEAFLRSPRSLLFSRLNKPSSLSLSRTGLLRDTHPGNKLSECVRIDMCIYIFLSLSLSHAALGIEEQQTAKREVGTGEAVWGEQPFARRAPHGHGHPGARLDRAPASRRGFSSLCFTAVP